MYPSHSTEDSRHDGKAERETALCCILHKTKDPSQR